MKQSKQNSPSIYAKISIISIITFLALFLGTLIVSLIAKTVLISNSIDKTKDSVYLYASATTEQIAPEELKPELFRRKPEISPSVATAVEDAHGKITGTTTKYKLENTISIIDRSVVADFLLPAAAELSETEIPLALPSNMSEYRQSELDYLKRLAPSTDFIAIASVPDLDHVYLVNNDSDKIANLLSAIIQPSEFKHISNLSVTHSAVAKFDDLISTKSYLKTRSNHNIMTIAETLFGIVASAPSPIGNTAAIENEFITFYNLFLIISFVLLIVTLFIVLFCQLAEHRQQSNQQLHQPRNQQNRSQRRFQTTKHTKSQK